MLTRALVVEDSGTQPNWFEPIFFKMAGFTYSFTTKSLATFDRIGVKEICLRCLLRSLMGFCLGFGMISARFHDLGSLPSRYELFRISATGLAKITAFSLKSQEGIPSGPQALVGLRDDRVLKTEAVETVSGSAKGLFTGSLKYAGRAGKVLIGSMKALLMTFEFRFVFGPLDVLEGISELILVFVGRRKAT